ncbi:MAG: hydrogenase formation protein HypD [Oscillibacter sp.]
MHCEGGTLGREDVLRLTARLAEQCRTTGPLRLMEVCGTHTMAIASSGLRSILPPEIQLVSGPGCPVCVTPAGAIDAILGLSELAHVTVASYGDLLRVPGSVRGDSLLRRRALGARVQTVYSPIEALDLAEREPLRQVVFLGVGFETTAPGTAAAILEAQKRNIRNFSVLSLLKLTPPALQTLVAAPDFAVNGFLCPGHVAAVIGSRAFAFLPETFGLPAVVAGFTPADLLYAISRLVTLLAAGTPLLENGYTRLVRGEGNLAGLAGMERVFEPCDSHWRGMGTIPRSGLALREEFAPWDAARRFGFCPVQETQTHGCCCGEVIRGVLSPRECPLFNRVCTPSDPVGPCMVSSEGACAAASRYGG